MLSKKAKILALLISGGFQSGQCVCMCVCVCMRACVCLCTCMCDRIIILT